ncbi:hypothetical protein [Leeuwenhoekiella sp. MAR_2009_132]|uniref:hypothetical protein n=1 Tax=Leeuwenhoekiella sp. MAR_2009_132 TaxID=1392489 RepID=UPI00048A70BD|nr:hypothetical protein [Leeuwenhoekiella sp. MAR_2009_132]
MENLQNKLSDLAKSKSEDLIGRRKYEFFKSLDLDNITEENIAYLEKTCNGMRVSEAIRLRDAYAAVKNPVNFIKETLEPKEKIIREPVKLTKEVLWRMFSDSYFANEKVRYSKSLECVENIKPLIYYFIGDEENFVRCKNVSLVSKPSLDKGLLIIGGYGNGKSSTMNALDSALRKSNITFRGYSANEVVKMYETCGADPQQNVRDKDEFWKTVLSGVKYFDDVLTERIANNFGKINLFNDIIQERYKKKLRTYISCNFNDEFPEDVNEGLAQFGEKYSSQVYDRLFEMFNVIVFRGKSFRK